MATLTAGISASTLQFEVSGDVSAAEPGTDYRIDDEVVTLREFVRTKAQRRGPRNPNMWSVTRGAAGTTAASHLAAAEVVAVEEAVTTSVTLTPPAPFAGEGGGSSISATDGTTTVEDVTSMRSALVTAGIAGEAVIGTCIISPTDPGAIGAGNLWLDSAAATDGLYPLFVRDPTDVYWLQASIGDTLSTDAANPIKRWVIVNGDSDELLHVTAALVGGAGKYTIRTNNVGGDDPISELILESGVVTLRSRDGGASAEIVVTPAEAQITGAIRLNGNPFGPAAHVANGSTVDQLRDALVASGLMEAAP